MRGQEPVYWHVKRRLSRDRWSVGDVRKIFIDIFFSNFKVVN